MPSARTGCGIVVSGVSVSIEAPFVWVAWVLGEFAEDVGDVGAGAFELLAAELAAPRAAEQDRGEVVDRPARAAAGGVAFPAAC